jgi:hypothetical protein
MLDQRRLALIALSLFVLFTFHFLLTHRCFSKTRLALRFVFDRMTGPGSGIPRLRIAFWLIAIGLGAFQAWASRHFMNGDGVSYIDMGDAYFLRDWKMILNGYWSPLYPLVIGLVRFVIQPSSYWEFSVVHLVNFVIYLCTLVCFEFLMGELIRYQRSQVARGPAVADDDAARDGQTLPEWACWTLGYTFFLWSSLSLISLKLVSPDMCVAAAVYVAAGLLLRTRRGDVRRSTFASMGSVLGIGYLAKAAMFPLAFVFFGVSLFTVGNLRRAVPRVLLALIAFSLVCGPFLVALSVSKDRLTFGDSGKLAYAWMVNGTSYRHWQGAPPDRGTPKHPTRKIFDQPAVYEFATPVGGTYPLWYDPSYWYEGVDIHFDPGQQIKVAASCVGILDVFLAAGGSLVLGWLSFVVVSRRKWLVVKDIAQFWFLLVPAMAAIGMYSLVYIEARYVAPFIVLLCVSAFCSVRLPNAPTSNTWVACVTMTILVMFGLFMANNVFRAPRVPPVDWQIASELQRMGVEPGDKVASIGYANTFQTRWARLARVKIISEIYLPDSFWEAEESAKAQAMQAFANAGADLIVTKEPQGAVTDGWRKIADTDYYVYFLRPNMQSSYRENRSNAQRVQ